MNQAWNQVEALWDDAEAANRRVTQARRQIGDPRGVATAAAMAWTRAEAAFARYEAAEVGWARARSALRVFRPDGRLNADFRGRENNQSSDDCRGQRKVNSIFRWPSHAMGSESRPSAASRRIGLWLRRSKVTVRRSA